MRLVTLDEVVPGGQPLFVQFVNTLHWYAGMPIEQIGSAGDLNTWLADLGLPALPVDGSLQPLHHLRERARAATEALAAGRAPAASDLAAVSAALAAASGSLVLLGAATNQPRLAFETDADDATLFALRIALSFATFLESGDRHRLKLCANPGCGFAFVDTSTNRTRRWCFMRYCGNRLKVRAFRRRRGPPDLPDPNSRV